MGKYFLSLLAFAGLALLNPACLQSVSKSVQHNEDLEDDSKYLKVHDHATRDHKIITDFETRFTLAVTYLSPEFRQAFSARFQRLFAAEQPFLEEATDKAGFFVSVFSPSREGYELTDDQLWSIQLKTKEGALRPILVKRLNQKERWRPFFKDVNQWSQEYLILFDTPSVSTSEKLVDKNALELHLANADARVKMEW